VVKIAADKLNNNFIFQPVNVDNYNAFLINIIIYSMLKYILARLLYGNFDINYLLGKYNKQFLIDLKNSEYYHFLDNFINPNSPIFNYDQYFLYNNKK
jgi:hypothetical protein